MREVRKRADVKWREHIRSSVHLRHLLTEPEVLDESVGPERFKIHSTHRVMAIRSVVFCKACGHWAVKKTQKLQRPCNLKPQNEDVAQKLRRMTKGLHPDSRVVKWPEGHDARVPTKPVFIDWHTHPD